MSHTGTEPTKVGDVEPSHGSASHSHHLSTLTIVAVYLLLSFYRIDHQSLWADEVLSLQFASPHASLFSSSVWFRGQGPLYFVLLHLWGKLGTSEFALRSLAALLGGTAVWLAYFLALSLFNRRTAVMTSILFATSPFLIWYGQEVRYITLMILTSLLAIHAFRRATASNRTIWWIACSCAQILAIASFVTNILLPAFQGTYLFFSPARRHLVRNWLLCQVLAFIPFVWWANGGYYDRLGGHWRDLFVEVTENNEDDSLPGRSQGLSSGGQREFTLSSLPYTFYVFSVGFSIGPSIQDLHVSRSLATLAPHLPLIILLGTLFGSLFLLGVIAIWDDREKGSFLSLWLCIPIIGVLVISSSTDLSYNVRYVAMALPAFLLILAVGIARLRSTTLQGVILFSLLIFNGASLIHYYFDPRYGREDARAAAQYLESATVPGDLILVVGNPAAMRYYYRGLQPLVSAGKLTNGGGPAVLEQLGELQEKHNRLWLVSIRSWQADPRGKVKAALDGTGRAAETKHFPGVELYCYHNLRKNRPISPKDSTS